MAPNENQPQQPQQPQQTPYEQQPVQQQYFAQQQQQPVQYVVMAQSLKGVRGWLMFWQIIFVLMAIGSIMMFFGAISGSTSSDGNSVMQMIFSPLMAIGSIATVVLVALEKKLGRIAALVTVGVSGLYGILNSIVSSNSSSDGPAMMVGGILVSLLLYGLWALYFVVSKRVKETLVK